MDISNEPMVVRQPHRGREEALAHAEGRVDTIGLTPLGHDVAMANDEPGCWTSLLEGTYRLAHRLTPEPADVVLEKVTGASDSLAIANSMAS